MGYSIDKNHVCFEAAAMFAVTWAGIVSAATLAMIARGYAEKVNNGSKWEFEPPELRISDTTLRSGSCTSTTRIINLGNWINYISCNDPERPDSVIFEYFPPVDNKISQQPQRSIGYMSDASFIVEQSTRQAIVVAYEINLDQIKEGLSKDRPRILQFFRHCRNACAHDNILKLNDHDDQSAPPKWRHLVLRKDYEEGLRFAGGFFDSQLVLPFLHDVGNWLSKTDGSLVDKVR